MARNPIIPRSHRFLSAPCCSKPIPVMLGRVFFLRKQYSIIKYLCILMMTAGSECTGATDDAAGAVHSASLRNLLAVAMFQMSGKALASEGFGGETFGLALCVVSLALDGLSGPQQEQLRTTHNLTTNQQMVVNNFWATIFMAAVAGAMGQLGYGVRAQSSCSVGSCVSAP